MLLFVAPQGLAEGYLLTSPPSCGDPDFVWSDTDPAVNVEHVFCGEIKLNDKPAGYHSQKLPSPVVSLVSGPAHGDDEIYDGEVTFVSPANPSTKLSTFFPDDCSVTAVIRSIVYAANNQTGSVVPWGVVGPSAPDPTVEGYCLAEGQPFTIRMGILGDGRVNTAFPYQTP